ncbi:hypothetical protein P9112_003621 [Eukaryota sp. TZLM1-RC]
MASAAQPYHECIRTTLLSVLCLRNFPSIETERHNYPEVEVGTHKFLLLKPITIARGPDEKMLIEPSINSVRISLKIKQSDKIDTMLVSKLTHFLMQRAGDLPILRRKALPGYDLSFLITNQHTESLLKHKLVDFIVDFVKDVDAEVSGLKLGVNKRARQVAQLYLGSF